MSLDQRTFSCTGGIAQTTVHTGNLTAGLAPQSTVGRAPKVITVPRAVAGASFAGQESVSTRSLAWLPCPEPHARWWFVGAGGAAVTHDTVLTVTNPRAGSAVIDIDVYGPKGLVDSPGLHGVTIAAGASSTIDLAQTAPAVGDLAVHIVAQRGLVAVSAMDRYSPGLLGKEVHEWLPPQQLPATSTTLAGLPPKAARSNLVIVNPGAAEAVVGLQVIGATGTFVPASYDPVQVPPYSTVTVPIAKILDGTPMALQVTSQRPVTATVRSVQNRDVTFATGVGVIHGSTAFAVPSGTGRLVLSSLGHSARFAVSSYNAAGTRLSATTVTVPARGSVAIALGPKVAYLGLVASGPAVVGGFETASGGGITAAGISPSSRSIRLPAVRQGW